MTEDATGYLLAGLAVFASLLGFRSRHLVVCLASAGLWVALWFYINDQAGLITGANLQIVTVACFGLAISMLLMGAFRATRIGRSNDVVPPYDEGEHGGVKGFLHRLNADEIPETPRSSDYETPEQYRAKVHRAVRPKRRRRLG